MNNNNENIASAKSKKTIKKQQVNHEKEIARKANALGFYFSRKQV